MSFLSIKVLVFQLGFVDGETFLIFGPIDVYKPQIVVGLSMNIVLNTFESNSVSKFNKSSDLLDSVVNQYFRKFSERGKQCLDVL